MSDNFGLPELIVKDPSKHKPLIKDLVEINKDDLSFQNDSNINAELRLWKCKWKVFLYKKTTRHSKSSTSYCKKMPVSNILLLPSAAIYTFCGNM